MATLRLRLLGQFVAELDGHAIEESRWVRKKAKSLIKLLALAPQRRMHREQLLDLLWPESEPETALNNFNKILHAARRVLEPDLKPGETSQFLITQETLLLLAPAPQVETDVDEFEGLAQQALRSNSVAELEAAEQAYRGTLLEEDLYEDWTSLRREQLALLLERVLDRLSLQLLEQQQAAKAEEGLQRLLRLNRTHEEAHRRLMQLYANSGRRHLALEQYRLCREALEQDLNSQPEPMTLALQEQIAAGTWTPEGRAAADSPPQEKAGSPGTASLPPGKIADRWKWVLLAAAIGIAAVAIWMFRPAPTRVVAARSLAVLPLDSPAQDEDLERFADGLTEGLIHSASRLPGIRVMARTTIYNYQGAKDPVSIGKALRVDRILNGRLEKSGSGNYRVLLELVDAQDGARLWGQRFEVSGADWTGLQQTLNAQLASVLAASPSGETAAVSRPATTNGEAYRLYLSGRYFSNQRSADALRKSVEYFQQAIVLDPNYALAYAGLADSYGLIGVNYGDAMELMPKARSASERALALDPTLAEAHTSLAMVHALFDWDWPGAEREFQAAIQQNPGYATAHHWYGVHLAGMGRFAEAQRELDRARELDPLSPIIHLNSGYPSYYRGQYAEALRFYDRAVELKPDFVLAHEDRMLAFEKLKRWPEAGQEAIAFLRQSKEGETADLLAKELANKDYSTALRLWLSRARSGQMAGFVSPMAVALLAVRAGEKPLALDWLERAYAAHSPMIVYVAVDPQFDALRAEPRFQALLQQLNLAAVKK